MSRVDIDIEEALRMASLYPAAFLGIDKRLGKLLPGFEASVTMLDHDLKVRSPLTSKN